MTGGVDPAVLAAVSARVADLRPGLNAHVAAAQAAMLADGIVPDLSATILSLAVVLLLADLLDACSSPGSRAAMNAHMIAILDVRLALTERARGVTV